MRVFVTGASGFIGTAVTRELLGAGHQVLGMVRSDAGAEAVGAMGAEVYRGDLEDLDSLRRGAAQADGVIHLAFNHDFSKFVANCEMDRRAIEALGESLAGSKRPLVVTSGTGLATPGPDGLLTEQGAPVSPEVFARAASEAAAMALVERDVRVMLMRLPQVHDTRKQGLVTYTIQVAREKGVSAYVGEGLNRWPAAPLLDVARLYRLALEKGVTGARYHAVAEEGVRLRGIAEVIGRGLKVPVVSLKPEEAPAHFGWMAVFAGWDVPASSAWTRAQLGWEPTGPTMMEDLERMEF